MIHYRGYRHTGGLGHQLVTKDDDILDPTPSQKIWNHSPDGFNWGSLMRDNRVVSQSSLISKFSYEGSWYSGHFAGAWDFMQKVNTGVGNSYMDNEEPHPQSRCQPSLFWNIGFEFDSSVYQYAFSLVGSDKIHEELITVTREINYIRETICGKMFISGDNLSLSPKWFRIRSIEPSKFSSTPYFTLELKPAFLNGEMLIGSPSGITSRRTIMMLPRSASPGIEGIRKLFGDDFPAKEAANLFCHLTLLTFYGYYITQNPTITRVDSKLGAVERG